MTLLRGCEISEHQRFQLLLSELTKTMRNWLKTGAPFQYSRDLNASHCLL